MIALFVHDDASADLEGLWESDPRAAARIAVLLEELEGDLDLLDRLTQHDYGVHHSADFHVSKWFEHWNRGRDLWRLKVWIWRTRGSGIALFTPSSTESSTTTYWP